MYYSKPIKILYAVQATGNGHIARAIELLPFLQKLGIVDVFLSGSNSNLSVPFDVKFKSKGVSLFYGNRGGLDYTKMIRDFSVKRIYQEAKNLPVENYDIVLNDFESITSIACKLKKVKSICFGHQASFKSSNTPRPKENSFLGELILQQYANASKYIGLHFKQYDDFIYNPIIKEEILNATPTNKNYVSVYLSHYSDEVVINALEKCDDVQFQLFSKKATSTIIKNNITILPISNDGFNKSVINSTGVITGAGFETPAEALYLGKKLLCIPIKGQYEQLCNAAALEAFNVPIIKNIDNNFSNIITYWLQNQTQQALYLQHSTQEIVELVINLGTEMANSKQQEFLLTDDDVATFAF